MIVESDLYSENSLNQVETMVKYGHNFTIGTSYLIFTLIIEYFNCSNLDCDYADFLSHCFITGR